MFQQLFRFCLIGVLNTGLDFFIYLYLTRNFFWMQQHYLIAASMAFIIAGLHGFLWSKFWTFANGRRLRQFEIMMFYGAAGSALIVNETILWLFVHFGYWDLIGKFFGASAAAVVNFILQRHVVFGFSVRIAGKKLS